MSFTDLLREHQRLSILRFLSEDPDYSLNTSILADALDSIGIGMSRDQINTECAWLDEQGLVTREDVMGVIVVTLTVRGADVAAGRVVSPGVKRPSPKG